MWPYVTALAYAGSMTELADAWVPGTGGKPVVREASVAVAFRRLAGAMESAGGNETDSAVQLADARWLLGDSAAKTIYAMQVRGQLPMPGTRAYDEFMAAAAAGDVEIVTEVRVRRAPAGTSRSVGGRNVPAGAPRPAGPAAEPESEPYSLSADLRSMGVL